MTLVRFPRKIQPMFVPATGTRLNLGCGLDVRSGFVNVDYIPATVGVVRCNWEEEHLPFADDTFNYVLARDIMEHVPHRTPTHGGEYWYAFIQEVLRVSRPGATWEVISPCRMESLRDPGHTRVITEGMFHPWSDGMDTMDTTSAEWLDTGPKRLWILRTINHRQADPRDWRRVGRAVYKTILLQVAESNDRGRPDR